MKKVYQTKYGEEHGNCYQACLASLLEIELCDVPDFCNLYSADAWFLRLNIWLRQFGLATLCVEVDHTDIIIKEHLRDCYVIASGKTKEGVLHSVIWLNGKIVHNPNVNCAGIEPETTDIIFPCDVSRAIRHSATTNTKTSQDKK